MSTQDIIREYNDAEFAYRQAVAEAVSGDEMVSLPQDVREARAALAIKAEARRFTDARIALEVVKAEREERYIAAHEDLSAFRHSVTRS